MKTKIIKSSDGIFAIRTRKWWRPFWMDYQEMIGPDCWSLKTFKTIREAIEYEAKIKEDRVYITWSDT